MAATNQNLKDFFALSGSNPAVTNSQLTRLQTWLDSEDDLFGSTANDIVDHLYTYLKDRVVARELSIAQDAVAEPTF